jgi:hypothetical protein
MRHWFQYRIWRLDDIRRLCMLGRAVCPRSDGDQLIIHMSNNNTYVVDQGYTFDMHMLSIKSVLEKSDNIMSNGILGGEAFGPRQNLARAKSSLLDWKGERKSKVNDVWCFVSVCVRRHIIC